MAYPIPIQNLPITPGSIWKFTVFLNGPNCGVTETYYIAATVGANLDQSWDNIALSYQQVRGPILHPNWSFQAYRYIDVTQPRGGKLRVPATWPAPGSYPYKTTDVGFWAAEINVGVQFRLSDLTQTLRRNEIYRGIPQNFIGDQTNGGSKIGNSSALDAFKLNLPLWFNNAGLQNPNLSSGPVLLRYFLKDPSVNKPAVIQTITTGANNWLEFTTLGINTGTATAPTYIAPPWVPGTQILIGGIRQKCAKKVNGLARVVSVTSQAGPPVIYTVTVCKPFCCLGQPMLCPQSGSLQLAQYNYARIRSADAEQIGAKKTGRPFRLRAGRRPACCL